MASKVVTYVWKLSRPVDDVAARKLMAVAYQSAMATDPSTTTVLIRAPIHKTTWSGSKWVPDDPHVTVAVKNPEQAVARTHQTTHGYTRSLQDPELVRVKPSGVIKSDDTKDRRNKTIWPEDLPTEEVVHQG